MINIVFAENNSKIDQIRQSPCLLDWPQERGGERYESGDVSTSGAGKPAVTGLALKGGEVESL
jgi:hypothetical protein